MPIAPTVGPERSEPMTFRSFLSSSLLASCALLALGPSLVAEDAADAAAAPRTARMVIVPESDRFTPFAVTIRAGDSVEWVNMDTDDHTVVSDDTFNTAGHRGTNRLLPGTDSNGGKPGRLAIRFLHAGTF